MKHRTSADRARRFCQALERASAGRSNWWVSIATVAREIGMDAEHATVLADQCAEAGLVQHDQSQHTKAGRRSAVLPHSVTLSAGGRALLSGQEEARSGAPAARSRPAGRKRP